MTLTMTADEHAMAAGDAGAGVQFAMEILHQYAEALGATRLMAISGAHIDGCLYHGQASLDFVDRLVEFKARVKVPTTLNVGAMDLIHPELVRDNCDIADAGRRLMTQHQALGCTPSFTCAPYQTMFRPAFGDQIAWGESNAIVFANSVIGARTNRYGDFIDLCCAIVGRVPAWGLHLDENRLGTVLFELEDLPATDETFVGVGMIIGSLAGNDVPVLHNLPQPRSEDDLKALGAAAATSGAVALFHAIGHTPEAPTLSDAFGGRLPIATHKITRTDVRRVIDRLSMADDGAPITAVCLGTPHFSRVEWQRLEQALAQWKPDGRIPIYVNTGRETLAVIADLGVLDRVAQRGVRPVADTCTYLVPILEDLTGTVMTNSGKWAAYAPGNLGVRAVFGNLEDCIASAAAGVVTRASRFVT